MRVQAGSSLGQSLFETHSVHLPFEQIEASEPAVVEVRGQSASVVQVFPSPVGAAGRVGQLVEPHQLTAHVDPAQKPGGIGET